MKITETNTVDGPKGFTDSIKPKDILSMIRCGILHHVSTTVSTSYVMRTFTPTKAAFKLVDDGSDVPSRAKSEWTVNTWYEDIIL